MVGVPGRSKGCITCRRRKKKCDLQYPWCNRCRDSKRTCEGYARYPIFLNRTTQGLLKRGRLEEAKVPGDANGTQGEAPWCQSMSQSSNAIAASSSSENIPQRELVRRQNVMFNSMPVRPSNAKIFEAQVISAFWEYYVPSRSNAQAGSPCAWLEQSICLSDPPPALRLSLVSLAMTRLGWLHEDEAFIRKGRVAYGHTLAELQKALYNEHSMCQDTILATCNVLALYELSQSTPALVIGYHSHVEALTRLIINRGSDRYKSGSPLAQAVLEETRLKTMFHSLIRRKASPLGSHEWCTLPWYKKRKDHGQKDGFQVLYEHGFALAALLEEIDDANLAKGNASAETVRTYLRRCSAMDARLTLCYQELVGRSESPMYWLTPLNDLIDSGPAYGYWAEVSNNSRPFSFSNLKMANLMTLYWTLKLVISNDIANICTNALLNPSLESVAQQMLMQHGELGRLENAKNVIRSMPYCLDESMGLLGTHRCLFSLRTAIFSLGRNQVEALNLCAQMYRDMYEKKGLGYAKQLADIGQK